MPVHEYAILRNPFSLTVLCSPFLLRFQALRLRPFTLHPEP